MSEYPPLANLNDAPLHGADTDGHGWACEGGTAHDWRCSGCVDAAEEAIKREGDQDAKWNPSAKGLAAGTRTVRLSWLVVRSRYFGV